MARKSEQRPRAEQPKPQTVPTASLRPNPHNPRMLFDEVDLTTLIDSIQKVGILVPITVYKASGSTRYTILDGQRRWICAERLGHETVPINQITEPTVAQNIVTMFQIHKLRKDWELMPTALKLEVLMEELEERRDNALAELTGLDPAVVTRCKKLLTYDEEYQNMMLHKDPKLRLRADLFIEMYPVINDRAVSKASWFDKDAMIKSLLRKYAEKLSGFKAITDFRKIKSYLSAAKNSGETSEILKNLRRFIGRDDMDISELEIGSARIQKEASVLTRNASRLKDSIAALDIDEYAAEETLWDELEDLVAAIKKAFASADRRAPK